MQQFKILHLTPSQLEVECARIIRLPSSHLREYYANAIALRAFSGFMPAVFHLAQGSSTHAAESALTWANDVLGCNVCIDKITPTLSDYQAIPSIEWISMSAILANALLIGPEGVSKENDAKLRRLTQGLLNSIELMVGHRHPLVRSVVVSAKNWQDSPWLAEGRGKIAISELDAFFQVLQLSNPIPPSDVAWYSDEFVDWYFYGIMRFFLATIATSDSNKELVNHGIYLQILKKSFGLNDSSLWAASANADMWPLLSFIAKTFGDSRAAIIAVAKDRVEDGYGMPLPAIYKMRGRFRWYQEGSQTESK